MASPFIRTIDRPTGKVTIDPNTGIPTTGVPALGLTPDGLWVPLQVLADGTVVVMTATGPMGSPYFDDAVDSTTPGADQTLIDQTVPANTTRNVSQVFVVTRVTGIYTLLANGVIIGSGRTGPAGTPLMSFNPPRPLVAGTEYQVVFTSRLNAPVQSVECYLQATDTAS